MTASGTAATSDQLQDHVAIDRSASVHSHIEDEHEAAIICQLAAD
jgi:hypothetical protein